MKTFHKLLVGCDGAIMSRFDSDVAPGSEVLANAVEIVLRAK